MILIFSHRTSICVNGIIPIIGKTSPPKKNQKKNILGTKQICHTHFPYTNRFCHPLLVGNMHLHMGMFLCVLYLSVSVLLINETEIMKFMSSNTYINLLVCEIVVHTYPFVLHWFNICIPIFSFLFYVFPEQLLHMWHREGVLWQTSPWLWATYFQRAWSFQLHVSKNWHFYWIVNIAEMWDNNRLIYSLPLGFYEISMIL